MPQNDQELLRNNPYVDLLNQRDAAKGTQLHTSLLQAADTSPERAAAAEGLAQRLNLPRSVVERNYDDFRKRAGAAGLPLPEIVRQTPALASWMSEPSNAAVAHDDLENLGFLEWVLTAPSRAFAQGVNQLQFARLSTKSLFAPLSQADRDLLNSYKFNMELGGELGARNSWFRKAIVGGSSLMPNIAQGAWEATQEGIKGGAKGAVVGAAGGALFEGVGAAPGAALGLAWGFRGGAFAGGWNFGFELEAGLAFDEFKDFRDEAGRPIDPNVAKAAALAAGFINGGLEAYGIEKFAKAVPGLRNLMAGGTRAAVRTALAKPTVRAALLQAMKSYGGTLTIETATEVGQRAVTILAGELAKHAAPGSVEGMVEPGNVNLYMQPSVGNVDGTVSTVDSITVGIDGRQYLLPRVTPDGRHLSSDEAIAEFRTTGQHLGAFASPETAEAFAQQVHNDYAAGLYNADGSRRSASDILADLAQEAAGAVTGFGLTLAPGPLLGLQYQRRQIRNAQNGVAFFQALGEGAKNSKTIARLPDAAQAFLEQAGQQATVYAPVDTFTEYWQKQNLDPADVAFELTGDPQAYAHAVRTGHDLAIPTAAYTVKLAGTPHNEFFQHELRLMGPDALNGRELLELADTVQTEASAPAADARGAGEETVRQRVYDRLVEAGESPATASAYADLWRAAVGTLAARAGVDPVALLERYGRPGAGGPEIVREGVNDGTESGRTRSNAFPDQSEGSAPIPASVERPNETGMQRSARRRVHLLALTRRVVADAQAVDPHVDPDVVAEALRLRVDQAEELQALTRESGRGQDLLRAVAAAGGLWWETRTGGFKGEIETLADEGFDMKRSGGALKNARGQKTWNGVPGVFRDTGQTPDSMHESLVRQHQQGDVNTSRFAHIEDANALIEAISDALRAEPDAPIALPGSAELEALGIRPGERWWTDTGARDGDDLENDVHVSGDGAGEDDVSFNFSQADRAEPVVTLTGEELGSPLTDLKALRNAAMKYYARELQHGITSIYREGFGHVAFTSIGRQKVKHTSADPTKLRLIPAIPAIIQHGTYVGSAPAYKNRVDGLVRFHYFTGRVQLGEALIEAGVSVGEDAQGRKFYNILPDPQAQYEKRKARAFPSNANDGTQASEDGGTTLDQSIEPPSDGVNLELLQDDGALPPGWNSIEPGPERKNVPPGRLSKGTYNSQTHLIRLLKRADLSTFLHESGHFFFDVLSDLVASGEASPEMRADLQTMFDRVGFAGTVDEWRALSTDERRDGHETFARMFEAYLLEGHAPSAELRGPFARFRAWLVGIYRSLRSLNVDVDDSVRQVFDRMLATDAAIDAAKAETQFVPLFTDAASAGVSDATFAAYQALVADASARAREELEARLLRDLAREQRGWWKEQREQVRAAVEAEFAEEPVYRARLAITKGTTPDGRSLVDGQEPVPFKLSKGAIVAQFGAEKLKVLRGLYSKDSGTDPDTLADMFGFASGEQLLDALIAAPKFDEVVDAETDARMRREHGDLFGDPEAMKAHAEAALNGHARFEIVQAELRALTEGMVSEAIPSADQITALAKLRIQGTRIKDLRPGVFLAAAQRASRKAFTLAAAGADRAGAVEAKLKEAVNLALYKEARDAQDVIAAARDDFSAMFKPDAQLAKRRNLDYVIAARAIASQFMFPGRKQADALEALEKIRTYDPDLYEALAPQLRAAFAAGTDLGTLTFEAFTVMRDTVLGLWHESRRSQQMLIDGQLVDRASVADAFEQRFDELKAPDKAQPKTERQLFLLGTRAALRRVESWVDHLDGGDPNGIFRRYLWTPISEAAAHYRVVKAEYLQRYLALVQSIETTLVAGKIAAPELGYTFESRAALLHALLHTGNESNKQKLLRGYEWGTFRDDGTVDDSRWRAFMDRMHQEGRLTKADWDFVQATWDLLEELKPQAQKAHREMYGHYFSEITAQPVSTPFGTYRGGYVPAVVDILQAPDAAVRGEKNSVLEGQNAFMFPTTGRGFTKQRKEGYAKPLALNLQLIPSHLDKVLRFVHLEPRVKDVARLVGDRTFRARLDAFDPTAGGDLLMPWLQRTASQRVVTPISGWGGKAADRFFRALRTRTGLNMMAANVINVLQQFTGLSIAAVKVKPSYLQHALWCYVRAPKAFTAAISERSEFMRTKVGTQAMEITSTLEDLLLNPSTYEKARAFGQRHGYFLQVGTQNVVDVVTWGGAYDQAVAEGAEELEAVRRADSAVRLTQGSFAPEDVSRFETGSAPIRAFSMFYAFFNMHANLLGSEFAMVARDMGLKRGAGRGLYVYVMGLMIPAVLSEVIRQAVGGFDDDGDDDHLDEFLKLFFGSQARTGAAMVPILGPTVLAGVNMWNDKGFDDRISTSPAITTVESAVHAPLSVYQSVVSDKPAKRAIRDTLSAVGLLTGLPVLPLARPLGYAADVAQGREEPTPANVLRGAISGRQQTARH